MPSELFTRRSFVAACAAALGGCARPPAEVAEPATAGEGRVLLATISSNYADGLRRLAREYNAAHPGAAVEIQIKPANGYETWLRTQIPGAGERGPDVINANYAWGMYEQGYLDNLTPHVERKSPYTGARWRDSLSEQFLEKLKIGGDIAIIPLDFIEIAFYYNQDLYARHGLRAPATWSEMLDNSRALQAAGVTPFAVPGNADSYWAGTVGWMARFFSDAITRDWVPQVVAQPGDWNYEPRYNDGWSLDLADPFNDAMVVTSPERLYNLILSGEFRFDGPRFAAIYRRIREFSGFWQRGFHGADAQMAYTLFLSGRAATMLDTSSQITNLLTDMADLPAPARFAWDLFPIPPLDDPTLDLPPFRGVGGAGVMFGVVKKNPPQTRRVVDFLMFVASPYGAGVLVEEALANRQPLTGPMLVAGADLPPELAGYFDVFGRRGFEKLSMRGLGDDQQSVWEWTVWAQRYMEGEVSLEEFLARYQELMVATVPRLVARFGHDLDPATKDTA